jgi:serine/threonine protein phosphatase PrpC
MPPIICCEPETGSVALIPGDLLLLATDGLHRFVAADTLADLLAAPGGVEAKASSLAAAALAAGGEDNITALVARIQTPARDETAPPAAGAGERTGDPCHDRYA